MYDCVHCIPTREVLNLILLGTSRIKSTKFSNYLKVTYGTFGQNKIRDVLTRFASKTASWPPEKGHVHVVQ